MKKSMFGFMLCVFFIVESAAQAGESIPLEKFSSIASGSSFLEQEAGISVYTKLLTVDLNKAEKSMDAVEVKTAEYVIGSIGLDDYSEDYDVHIYVDISGWVVAYYSKNEPASKIIDWVAFSATGHIGGSKLENALTNICTAMYLSPTSIKYYDFRFSDATRIMIVADEEDVAGSTETFNILIPSDMPVFSRSCSHAMKNIGGRTSGNIKIDDTVLHSQQVTVKRETRQYQQIR
jgi:hypothetical protein